MLDPPLLWQLLCSLPLLVLAVVALALGCFKIASLLARTEHRDPTSIQSKMGPPRGRRAVFNVKVRSRAARRAAKRRSFWGRLSLASSRRTSGGVPKRHRVIRTSLVSLLQLIFDLPAGVLTHAQRESLAVCLTSYNEVSKPGEKFMATRPRKWILTRIWPTIAAETNQAVRGYLLLMAAQFYEQTRECRIWEVCQDLSLSVLLSFLEQNNARHKVLKCTVDMLADVFHDRSSNEFTLEDRLRVAQAWFRLVEAHRAPLPYSNDVLALAARLMIECFPYQNEDLLAHSDALASALLMHDRTLPFLFCEIKRAAAANDVELGWWFRPLDALGEVFATLLEHSSVEQRATMLTLHSVELLQTFHLLPAHLVCRFFDLPEYRAVIVQNVSLVELMWRQVRHQCTGSHSGAHWIQTCPKSRTSMMIFDCLENALNDSPRLQHFLGLGMLYVADHFAKDESAEFTDDGYTQEAGVFRQILTLHPEWVIYYKELTQDGANGNEVAKLGRRLGYRIRPKGVYILEEGVDQI